MARAEDFRLVEQGGQTWGLLYLRGTKRTRRAGGTTRSRDREIWIFPRYAAMLSRSQIGQSHAGTEGRLFPLLYSRFYTIWKKAVRRASLTEAVLDEGARTYEPLRPHDCRHIYAMLAERASLIRTKVQKAGLGHARLAQTLDYTDRETAFTTGEMRAIDGVLSSEAESMPVKQAG